MGKQDRLKLIIDRVKAINTDNVELYVIEVDYSHGIIYGVDTHGEEHEATWSGCIDLDAGDTIYCSTNSNDDLVLTMIAA